MFEMKERDNNFGILKLIAAMLVIIGHMYNLLGYSAPAFLWKSIHGIGVVILFTVGGYLNALSYLKDLSYIKYLIKRIFRIFPPLIFCVMICIFIVGPWVTEISLKEYFTHPMTWGYLKNIILNINYILPGCFLDNPYANVVNGSIWCLPLQFLLYLLIPIYIKIGKRMDEIPKVQKFYYYGSTLVIIVISCVYQGGLEGSVFYHDTVSKWLELVPYWFVGSLFAICKIEKYLNLQVSTVMIFFGLATAFATGKITIILQYILLPYIVLSFAVTEKAIFKKFNMRDISYGIFLFGFVIQQFLIWIFIKNGIELDIFILLILSIGLSAMAGIITEILLERPLKKICSRYLKNIK